MTTLFTHHTLSADATQEETDIMYADETAPRFRVEYSTTKAAPFQSRDEAVAFAKEQESAEVYRTDNWDLIYSHRPDHTHEAER